MSAELPSRSGPCSFGLTAGSDGKKPTLTLRSSQVPGGPLDPSETAAGRSPVSGAGGSRPGRKSGSTATPDRGGAPVQSSRNRYFSVSGEPRGQGKITCFRDLVPRSRREKAPETEKRHDCDLRQRRKNYCTRDKPQKYLARPTTLWPRCRHWRLRRLHPKGPGHHGQQRGNDDGTWRPMSVCHDAISVAGTDCQRGAALLLYSRHRRTHDKGRLDLEIRLYGQECSPIPPKGV